MHLPGQPKNSFLFLGVQLSTRSAGFALPLQGLGFTGQAPYACPLGERWWRSKFKTGELSSQLYRTATHTLMEYFPMSIYQNAFTP